jgi:hypothetical protein
MVVVVSIVVVLGNRLDNNGVAVMDVVDDGSFIIVSIVMWLGPSVDDDGHNMEQDKECFQTPNRK